ncbi:hypothetical protein T492DRAFT_912802 [Pavlovales sp. CCMP2436]|nr:hypothetical protein T492DRAFT_912802 [Pavlovales sp. CCMP2436]
MGCPAKLFPSNAPPRCSPRPARANEFTAFKTPSLPSDTPTPAWTAATAILAKSLGRDVAIRFFLVFALNAFDGGDRDSSKHLFGMGSRLNHSCAPNCSRTIGDDGRLVVRALRPIAKDEELTVSYLEPAMLLRPAAVRNAMLAPRGFACSCERCSGFDDARSFACLACARGLVYLPIFDGVAGSPCDGCGAALVADACARMAADEHRLVERAEALDANYLIHSGVSTLTGGRPRVSEAWAPFCAAPTSEQVVQFANGLLLRTTQRQPRSPSSRATGQMAAPLRCRAQSKSRPNCCSSRRGTKRWSWRATRRAPRPVRRGQWLALRPRAPALFGRGGKCAQVALGGLQCVRNGTTGEVVAIMPPGANELFRELEHHRD